MLNVSPAGMDRYIISARAEIAHPLADEISMAFGDGASCHFPHTVELAFFAAGEWVYETLSEFAAYYSGGVYVHVPLHMAADFLKSYATKGE